MNNKTLIYGLLLVGGTLAYFSWKNKKTKESNSSIMPSNNSRTFIDDKPLTDATDFIKDSFKSVKNTTSQIIEPFVNTVNGAQLSGKGDFIED
jgi:hypothetical protein